MLAGLSEDPDGLATDAAPAADDLVLLATADELADPVAVVRAAAAAGVQAIHPGYGPLRGDARLARAASDAGLVAIVTTGVATAEENARTLSQSVSALPWASDGSPATRWVYVLGAPTGVIVLGSVAASGDRVIASAPDSTESAAHRLGHAVAAVLGLNGLATVGVGSSGVVDVVAGLPETHAAWELVTDVDLVELQLLAATGKSTLTAQSELPRSGVAIGRVRADVVEDIRTLDRVTGSGLRLDAVALAGSAHGALVRLSAWGRDLAEAEQAFRSIPSAPR